MRLLPFIRILLGGASVLLLGVACVGLENLSSDDTASAHDATPDQNLRDSDVEASSTDAPTGDAARAPPCVAGSCDAAHTCIDGVCQWTPTTVGGAGRGEIRTTRVRHQRPLRHRKA